MNKLIITVLLLAAVSRLDAGDRIVPIRYGDMEHWTVRYIKESSMLGGQTKTLYVLAPTDTIRKNAAYDFSRTIWGISNAFASPAGIDKGSNTVQPERRGAGHCARLDTRMEAVKVLGGINMELLVQGSLFLGAVVEPVKSTNDPYSSIDVGIHFTGRPKALMLDYKAKVNPEQKILTADGFGKKKWRAGHDEPEVYVYLQKRWEDKKGNIYARRVGTMRYRIDKSTPDWQNNVRLAIHYGDITGEPFFKKYMGLYPDGGQFKARNSKGKMVNVTEVGWAETDEQPTHVVLMITSGCYPVFTGYPGNTLWVDNVRWVY